MLRAIVFDFDGVIANSEPLHFVSLRDVLAEEGITLIERDYYDRYLGYDDTQAFEAIGTDHGVTWEASRIAALAERKAARLATLERDMSMLFPGAADMVRQAAAAVPIAIASGARGDEIHRVLDREGLSRCFTAIVAAEDAPTGKPAPDPYLRVVALLAAAIDNDLKPGDCVAIEDSHWGLESARTAGLRTVGVTHTYAAIDLRAADLIVSSIAQLDLRALAQLCT